VVATIIMVTAARTAKARTANPSAKKIIHAPSPLLWFHPILAQ